MLKSLLIAIVVLSMPVIASSQAPDTLWTRYFFSDLITYEPWQVIETSDSGLAVVGTRKIEAENQWDILLMKINSNGDTLWTKYLDYSNIEEGRSLKETPDHGFIITGYKSASVNSPDTSYLLKTDSLGNLSWYLPLEGNYLQTRSIDLAPDGGFIVTGWAAGDFIHIIKTDSLGAEEWHRTYNRNLAERPWSIRATSDSGYILAGWRNSEAYHSQILVMKLDSSGDTLWTRTCGNPSYSEEARAVVETIDGYIVVGDSASADGEIEAVVMKFSQNGERIWSRLITDFFMANSVFPASSGDILVVGFGGGIYKAFIAKFDSVGNRQWLKIYRDIRGDTRYYGRSIIETSDHGAVYAGYSGNSNFTKIMLAKFAPDDNTSCGDNVDQIPDIVYLGQNYPNPFNGKCLIEYTLPNPSVVRLDVYDILGQKVATLENGYRQAGVHRVIWEGDALPSGLYFYRLSANTYSETRKMLLLK